MTDSSPLPIGVIRCHGSLCNYLFRRKLILADAAFRANPVSRHLVKWCSRLDTVLRIAQLGIVHVSADITDKTLHNAPLLYGVTMDAAPALRTLIANYIYGGPVLSMFYGQAPNRAHALY